MGWFSNRKERASNERMAIVLDAMAKAQDQVRAKRLALEEVIAEMAKDREDARDK